MKRRNDPSRLLRLTRPKSVLAFCLCGLVAAWAVRPLSSAQADGGDIRGPAMVSAAWFDPSAPTLGTLLGREHDVQMVTVNGSLRFNVFEPSGEPIAMGLTAQEVARVLPDLDLGALQAGGLDADPPDATLMLADVPGW